MRTAKKAKFGGTESNTRNILFLHEKEKRKKEASIVVKNGETKLSLFDAPLTFFHEGTKAKDSRESRKSYRSNERRIALFFSRFVTPGNST